MRARCGFKFFECVWHSTSTRFDQMPTDKFVQQTGRHGSVRNALIKDSCLHVTYISR